MANQLALSDDNGFRTILGTSSVTGEVRRIVTTEEGYIQISATANIPVDIMTISGATVSFDNGTVDAGTMRVTIASDSTGQVNAIQSGTWTFTLSEPSFSLYPPIIDKSTAGTTYFGWCAVGSSTDTASAVWRIKRSVESSGVVTFSYADGNADLDNIWNDRASLTYS